MLPAALTAERVRLPDGTSATRYPWNGEDVLVRDDALTIIRVIEVLTDEGKSDDQRRDEFLALFFVDWADAWCACDYDAAEFMRMCDAAVWDMCGLDLTGDRPHETPLWDLEEDAARIRTSFRQAYGIEWDEVRGRISFAEFVALVGGCPQDTPLGAAIHYRNPATKPKPTKYNRQEVEAWNAAHKAFELGKGRSSHGSEEGSDAAMRDVFAALKKSDEVSMDGNVIIKAVLDTVDVSKNIKALERDLQGISWKNITEGDEKAAKLSSSFKKAGTAATLTLTAPVVAAGKAVFGVASDYEQANARIAAAFGVSGEEAERFSGIGKRIYEGGWGESLDEVNDALIQCKSTLRDVSDEDLQTVTTNALMLSDTFGADVNESIRGTNALMEGFGLSATEASDLLTAGMQRGLNYTDELGDNLSEYSVRWGEAGMSASEYFSLLEAGTSNGAYNLDKVGDYLNEFLTALSDGRMEESIGSFSEGTQEVFENFKNGSATAEDMLQAVLGDLTQMPNEYDKAALASTLWSSLGEDNAMGMIESLAGVQDSFGDVAGAAQQAQEAASDSFAVKSQEAMRELQGSIEPLGEPLLNIATNVAGVVKSFSEWFAGIGEGGQTAVLVIAGIVAALGPVLSTVGTVIDTVPKIGAAFQTVGKLGTGALGLIAAHPVIAAIAAIIAAVVLLWNNCEEFRDAVTAVWDAVCAAFEVAIQVAGDVAQSVGEFFSQLGETLGGVWDGICSTVQGAIDAIAGFFQGLADTASSIWDGICNVVQVAVMLLGEILNLAIETLLIPWNFIWENFGEQLTAAWDAICSAVGGYIDAVSQAITDVVTALSEWWGATWEGISCTASAIWEAIYGAVSAYIQYVSDVIGAALGVIQGVWDTVWGAVSFTASSIWDAISSAIGAAINAISSTISAVLSAIQAVWDSIWGAVSSTASSMWGGISSTISSIVNGIRDTISSVFNAAKDTVSSVWNSIKSAIETPIQNARDTVRNVIDSIKGFFNFSWSLPHLKLPHLSISGSFSIAPPSVPHFGIDWYAKGGVFNGPSVIGVGEAGPEGVVPFNERGARPLAEGIAKLLDGKGGAAHGDTNVTINLYATVREEADIEKISRQIAKEIKRQECFA